MLTPGNVSDVKAAPALLERAGRMRYLLGDKGYDADRLRRSLREVGVTPVIPGRRNRKRAVRFDQQRYRGRHLIENAFCRLKDFRRVATRYDVLPKALPVITGVRGWYGAPRGGVAQPAWQHRRASARQHRCAGAHGCSRRARAAAPSGHGRATRTASR